MVTSDPELRHTKKTLHRSNFVGENGTVAVQILGNVPQVMAEAARYNVELGAQVIDINMGCPAKKVCNVLAGSALMQDEVLVGKILEAVVQAVDVPVTLKTRLGWHGRTRTQMYQGEAHYELIAEAKGRLKMPVWVNGDITSPYKASDVLRQTGADGIMIGRGAQGRPWLFRDLKYFAEHGRLPAPLSVMACGETVLSHVRAMYEFYGETSGLRILVGISIECLRVWPPAVPLIGSTALRHNMMHLRLIWLSCRK